MVEHQNLGQNVLLSFFAGTRIYSCNLCQHNLQRRLPEYLVYTVAGGSSAHKLVLQYMLCPEKKETKMFFCNIFLKKLSIPIKFG